MIDRNEIKKQKEAELKKQREAEHRKRMEELTKEGIDVYSPCLYFESCDVKKVKKYIQEHRFTHQANKIMIKDGFYNVSLMPFYPEKTYKLKSEAKAL